MIQKTIYGRIVTKSEFKLAKKTQMLIGEEFVPAFDATFVFDRLELSNDEIKTLGILFGESGEATYLMLFRAESEPVVKDILLRNSKEIKKMLGKIIKEVKFASGTKIELIKKVF